MITWIGVVFGLIGAVYYTTKGEHATAMWAATSGLWALNCKAEELRRR